MPADCLRAVSVRREGSPRTREEGRRVETLEIVLPRMSRSASGPDSGSARRCPGNQRALFTSIGALHLAIAAKEKLRIETVIICVV